MKTQKAISILERQNYISVTEKLKEAVGDAVETVCKKMKELDTLNLHIEGVGTLILSENYANGGQFRYELFQWDVEPYDDEDLRGDLQSTHYMRADGESSGTYYAGDFNHWYGYPSRSAVMKFALNFDKIIKSIEKLENDQVEESEKAINKLK